MSKYTLFGRQSPVYKYGEARLVVTTKGIYTNSAAHRFLGSLGATRFKFAVNGASWGITISIDEDAFKVNPASPSLLKLPSPLAQVTKGVYHLIQDPEEPEVYMAVFQG